MEDTKIEEHVTAIINAAKETNKPSKKEITDELKRFLEYGVPLQHATQTLMKKYGGDLQITPNQQATTIADLQKNQFNVNLICRVVSIQPKDTTIKGEQKTLFYGILGDKTGTIPFTAWQNFNINKDDVIKISNAYTREWQGLLKLNLSEKTHIEQTDSSLVPNTDIESKKTKIKDLQNSPGLIEITVCILSLEKRTVTTKATKKTVYSGEVGDETGKTQFTAWHDFKLKENDVIHIKKGYVKTWKGIPQITIDNQSIIKKLPSDTILTKNIPTPLLRLHELEEQRGGYDIAVKGTVIEIREGSGIIQRCPECNRAVQNDSCPVHGQVTTVPDLRIKLIIDDGIAAAHAILDQTASEKLLNTSFSEIQKLYEKEGSTSFYEELNTKLFGHELSLKGNALHDNFGITILAQDAKMDEPSIQQLYTMLTEELETIS